MCEYSGPMRRTPYAFTRFDLLALVSAFALITAVTAPVLAGRGDIDRAVCANNLRLIGSAIQSLAMEHEQRVRWWTPVSEGGSYYVPKAGNAWFEFYGLSNGLVRPAMFVCPADLASDPTVRPAKDFPEFGSAPLRQNAVSYAINIHSGRLPENQWMISDRNLRFDSLETPCALSGINNAFAVNAASNTSNLAWTNRVHGEAGNVLSFDGGVEFTSTARVRELMLRNEADGVSAHVIKAR